jgi:FAD:protein FMN transferase
MLTVGGILAFCVLAAEPELTRFELRQTHMGTEFKIVLYCADAATARRASDAAFARIAALDAALSDYNPESELMRLCDRAGSGAVTVSKDLYRVLERSLEMSHESDGAFDVTVGPLVHLWRRARRQRKLPDADKLAAAKKLVGYQNIRLDPKARTVELLKPAMRLDLGGIAKGFASDEAVRVLRQEGINIALVAGAGDIAVSDPPPGSKGWRIAISPVQAAQPNPSRSLSLRNACVSTAGDAEQFVEIDGKRYSHIVDPRTGLGVVRRASVTVIAQDGATADSLDTAVYVLGPERGLALVEQTDGSAALYVWIGKHGDESLMSKRFSAWLETQDPGEKRP